MNKLLFLKIVNPLLFVLVLLQGVTVLLSKFTTPPDWFWELHEYGGYGIFALALLHLILNWSWVKSNFFPKKPKK